MMELKDLQNLHKGKPAYIVGKGASLEFLTRTHFAAGPPVICINEAIVIVQDLGIASPLYSLQKDGDINNMFKPHKDVTLLLQNVEGYSRDFYPEHVKRVLIDPVIDQNFLYNAVMSVRMCINLARYMGCKFISLVCCDALVNGDMRTFDVFTGKAGATSAAEWYEKSIPDVLSDLKAIPHKFITPELKQ